MAEALKDKKGFMMYKDWGNLLCLLNTEQKGKLLDGIFKYQCNGEIDGFNGDTALQAILNYLISIFDNDDERYSETCKRNKENGKKGGRPKKTEQNPKKAVGYFKNRTKAKKPDIDIDIDKDKDMDMDKDIDILSVSDKPKQTKHKCGKFKNVLLSDKDIETLKEKFPFDYQAKIENLSEGIELKGYKYKNHCLAIIKWAQNDKKKNNTRPDLSDPDRYKGDFKL